MNDKEVSTISLVAHENSNNRLYKVIRLLIIAIIVICIAFASYICYDRYLDVTVTDASDMSLEQKPARRWEDLVKYIATTLIGAIIMYLLNRIGLV